MSRWHRQLMRYMGFSLLFLVIISCAPKQVKTGIELGEPKSEMFVSTKELLDRAVSERADELAPEVYEKALNRYVEAEDDFEKGKDTAKIEEKLEETEQYAMKAIEVAQIVRKNFPQLVESRDKAIAAKADAMDLDSYNRAEKYLQKTAAAAQKDGLAEARKHAEEGYREYQSAELEAIQRTMVGDLNEQITEAKKMDADKWAPETYQKAKEYRDAALKTLAQDRYQVSKAQQEALQGEYQARKAMFLAEKIKEAKGDRVNWEKLFLAREKDLDQIADTLGLEPAYDEGYDKPVSEIDQAIRELKGREQALASQLQQTEQSLAQARAEYRQVEQLAREHEREKESIYEQLVKPVQPKDLQEQIAEVQALFKPEEAKVTMDHQGNVVINLAGLNFDFGTSTLKPGYYSLLNQVKKAADVFPDRNVRVTGHTDSVGASEFNKRLSLERARSVAQYLDDALGLPAHRIEIRGAGESEPIAPNTTPQGRRLNRRIEISFMAQ
ncbi:MAG: OmpA family protein [bacterium]